MLGRTFYGDQQEAVITYLVTGVRPNPDGCYHCDAWAMLQVTLEIDKFEDRVESGEVVWPWTESYARP